MSRTKSSTTRVFSYILSGVLVAAGSAWAQDLPQDTTQAATTCGQTTWDLTAGQTIKVGNVQVANDANNVYVTYSLNTQLYPTASFGTLHLWIGNDIAMVPSNRQGTPVPGQFASANGGAAHDATGLTSYTFTIPFSSLSVTDAAAACGSTLFVVTHAEVNVDSNGDGVLDHETAFGGPTPGSGARWWFYGQYSVCCTFGPPGDCEYDTAFGKGGFIFTTDKKSNPERLPSLNLTRNRWGWAINIRTVGTTTYPIYSGAGLNKIENGTLVGELRVTYNGSSAAISYLLNAPHVLDEVHIYAADGKPTTVAPGQYGFPTEGYEVARRWSFEYTVPVTDTDGDGIWIIAHAVVSKGVCAH